MNPAYVIGGIVAVSCTIFGFLLAKQFQESVVSVIPEIDPEKTAPEKSEKKADDKTVEIIQLADPTVAKGRDPGGDVSL